MGYRMEYGNGNQEAVYRKIGKGKQRVWAMSVIVIVLLLCAYFFKDQIVDVLLPGDPEVTRKAIRVFVNELRDGEQATDAFEAFCKVIIHEANLS